MKSDDLVQWTSEPDFAGDGRRWGLNVEESGTKWRLTRLGSR
jgi:hypothetical protein